MVVEILRGVWVDGRPLATGQVVDLPDSAALTLIQMGKARPVVAAAETAAVQPVEDAARPTAKPRTTATRKRKA